MSAIANVSDQISSTLTRVVDLLKKNLLGANNERLDFIMDSFYKLSPNQQSGFLLGACAGLFLLVVGAFGIYFSNVSALESELNAGFESLQNLRQLSYSYEYENKRYRELTNIVRRGSDGFRPKPFFEQKSNQIGVSITDLRSNETEINSDSPLSNDFRHVNVEFRLPKVSIPRLLKFLGEVEKSGKHLNIQSLQIRTRYGDRLFFETNAKVVGYRMGSRN